MNDAARSRARLDEALARMAAGDLDGARATLEALRADPAAGTLGHPTVLGLPRKLHSGFLKLAKAERDAVSTVGYQHTLVPPPERILGHLRLTADDRRAALQAERTPVPRILHQVWIGPRPPPPTVDAWRRHAAAQGLEHRLWREEALAALGIGRDQVYRAMAAAGDFPGMVDVARYHILARHGGIYLDCDWYPARDDIGFHDRMALVGLTALAEDVPRRTGSGSLLLGNAFIAAPAGHPAFARLIDTMPRVQAELPGAPAWWVTGPLLFTLVARGGTVTLADAGLVAGAAPPETTLAEIAARCEAIRAADGGLLLAWKPWAAEPAAQR